MVARRWNLSERDPRDGIEQLRMLLADAMTTVSFLQIQEKINDKIDFFTLST